MNEASAAAGRTLRGTPTAVNVVIPGADAAAGRAAAMMGCVALVRIVVEIS
jgi:hypothetical protein